VAKILITGGAGFIGSHLASVLAAAGHRVVLADNLSRGARDGFVRGLLDNPEVTFVPQDLVAPSDLAALGSSFEYIYHLSALLGVQNVLRRPFAVLRDNVAMLVNVLAFAQRQSALRRLVFASTSEVYAGTLEHFHLPIPTPETVPLALPDLASPRTSYMLSKLYGEALCRHSGLPVTIVRPHNIYGPRMGMAHVIPELLNKAHACAAGGAVDVFSTDHRRTFCFITDGVELIRRAGETLAAEGQVLNVGNQAPEISIAELAGLIFQVVGKDLAVRAQPATPGSPVRRCPDMTKTLALTGYRPVVELRDGIKRTYAWYQANVFNRECKA
jgi:nucleoside-diphosphate-sugar epimerase